MSETAVGRRQRVILVEEDPQTMRQLCALFARYNEIEVETATDGGRALELLTSGATVDAMVLDLMLPYGSAADLLGGDDPQELEMGLNLLAYIHRQQTQPSLRWVAVITARSGFAVGKRVRELLDGRGKLYQKPFDTLQLEDDVVRNIGVSSQVPPDLLLSDKPRERGSES